MLAKPSRLSPASRRTAWLVLLLVVFSLGSAPVACDGHAVADGGIDIHVAMGHVPPPAQVEAALPAAVPQLVQLPTGSAEGDEEELGLLCQFPPALAPAPAPESQPEPGDTLLASAVDLPALRVLAAAKTVPLEPKPEESRLPLVLRGLMCLCGCALTVAACEGAMVCDVARRMKEEALGLLSGGKTVAETLDAFAENYGERVLAAPTKRGFNLTAWVMPFVGLGSGLLVVVLALLKWRGEESAGDLEIPPIDPSDLALVDEAVERGI